MHAQPLAAVAQSLGAHWVEADVSNENAVREAVKSSAAALGGLDGVANVAGIVMAASLGEITLSDWNRVIGVNLNGPYLICREALPHLQKNSNATIVNVSSGSAFLPVSLPMSSYIASKAAVIAFSKALAYELAPKIRVNAVCPGAVDTPMLQDNMREAALDPARSPYALKRVAAPEEVAHALLYLTSNESSYVTGSTLVVDGGRTFH
jgi:NAD(P)-dependent dehydrogenase (short-subunit alcohol dehydrogenase family)